MMGYNLALDDINTMTRGSVRYVSDKLQRGKWQKGGMERRNVAKRDAIRGRRADVPEVEGEDAGGAKGRRGAGGSADAHRHRAPHHLRECGHNHHQQQTIKNKRHPNSFTKTLQFPIGVLKCIRSWNLNVYT